MVTTYVAVDSTEKRILEQLLHLLSVWEIAKYSNGYAMKEDVYKCLERRYEKEMFPLLA